MLPQRRFPRDGQFTAYIPRQLTTLDLRRAAAPLEAVGFPGKIAYAGLRRALLSPRTMRFVAEYRPRFETFIHAGPCRKLTYRWTAGGCFHVDVLHDGDTGDWNVYKFRSGQLMSHIAGQGYGEAMIRATALGLDASEPGFTVGEDPKESRRENMAQAEAGSESQKESGEEQEDDSYRQTLVFGVVTSARGDTNLVFLPVEKARDLAQASRTRSEFNLTGDYLVLDAARSPEILAALEAAGYDCRWDEELVRRACGIRVGPTD